VGKCLLSCRWYGLRLSSWECVERQLFFCYFSLWGCQECEEGVGIGAQAGKPAPPGRLITPDIDCQEKGINLEISSTKGTESPKIVKLSRPRPPAWLKDATPAVRRAYERERQKEVS